ncbi:MAG: cysteine-rich CWC family protein, partial [Steroidobacteraceae bacterium]
MDRTRCPRCGRSNACGIEAGQKKCWCFEQAVSREALDSLPASARGASCLCITCAAAV